MSQDAPQSGDRYFHGYSGDERARLFEQAEYWRESLIPVGLDYQSGQRVLEIGCAVGAALAVLARRFPGIKPSGVDIESLQIEAAKEYFASSGLPAEFQVSDGRALPFRPGSFDHVFIMWLVEHLQDPAAVLREAHRVLGGGGTITLTETDYTSFRMTPPSEDWDYVQRAQYEFFARFGSPDAGRQLGPLLQQAGFSNVTNRIVGFHFFHGDPGLRKHCEYVCGFLEPGIAQLASLGFDAARIERGIESLRRLPEHQDSSFTQLIYRAIGTK